MIGEESLSAIHQSHESYGSMNQSEQVHQPHSQSQPPNCVQPPVGPRIDVLQLESPKESSRSRYSTKLHSQSQLSPQTRELSPRGSNPSPRREGGEEARNISQLQQFYLELSRAQPADARHERYSLYITFVIL